MTNGSPRHMRRRENLRKLLGDEPGAQAQLALEIGTPKSHLSAILAGRRGIGDALAQKIERRYGLAPGQLDSDTAGQPSTELADLFAAIDRLPPKQRDWVLLTLREAVKLARETVSEPAEVSQIRKSA